MVFKETFGNVIESLNDLMDLAALVPFLQELGARHHTRGITKYFDVSNLYWLLSPVGPDLDIWSRTCGEERDVAPW